MLSFFFFFYTLFFFYGLRVVSQLIDEPLAADVWEAIISPPSQITDPRAKTNINKKKKKAPFSRQKSQAEPDSVWTAISYNHLGGKGGRGETRRW